MGDEALVDAPITKTALDEALAAAKAQIECEIAARIAAPNEVSTRFILTKYLIVATLVITLAVMIIYAFGYPVPEIATGVVLMGTFNAMLTAVMSYFESRKEATTQRMIAEASAIKP